MTVGFVKLKEPIGQMLADFGLLATMMLTKTSACHWCHSNNVDNVTFRLETKTVGNN